MPEPRSPVMILVKASWEDQSGTLQSARACMVNRSDSGTCLRLKVPIDVGSRLTVQWRWEEFSGLTKYCRRGGSEYFVGIKRDTPDSGVPAGPSPKPVPIRENGKASSPRVPPPQIPPTPKPVNNQSTALRARPLDEESAQIAPTVNAAAMLAALRSSRQSPNRETGRLRPPPEPEFDALRRKELQMQQPPMAREAGKDKKHMARKWLGLGNWGDKQEELNGNNNASSSETVEARRPTPEGASPALRTPKSAPIAAEEAPPDLPDELMALEDIYRTAGIANPRKGYTITKVVDMLHSEHMRGLSKEMKRASVLMALDAAGISTDALLDDAKARIEAIDSYEAAQRILFEAEWARRAEENVQIQAELESLKARYMDRLKRNQDGIARERATFGNWLTGKQQESQSIVEAVELCLKPAAPEPASAKPPAATVAEAV